MQSFIINEVRRYLSSFSDDDLLKFVSDHLLDRLTAQQLQKLQALVNVRVGMSAWFVRVAPDALEGIASNLDLATIRKVQGVFDEAEARRKANPLISMEPRR